MKRKAQLLNIGLPDDVTEYIAQKLKTNIRQLEGAVKRMKAYHSIEGHPPTILLAQRAIKDILSDSQPVPVTVEKNYSGGSQNIWHHRGGYPLQ